jgi:hypothetical protein
MEGRPGVVSRVCGGIVIRWEAPWSFEAPWCSGQACWPLEPATAVRIRSGLSTEGSRYGAEMSEACLREGRATHDSMKGYPPRTTDNLGPLSESGRFRIQLTARTHSWTLPRVEHRESL